MAMGMTLYVSDLDGTLLGKDERLSEFTLWALNHLIERGMHFTFATARSNHSAVRVTQGLTRNLPVIVYNGAFILEGPDGKPLFRAGFTPEQAAWVEKQAEALSLWPVVYAFVEGVERLSWVRGKETPGQAYYLQNREWDKRLRGVSSQEALYQGEAFYFTFIGEREALLPLYQQAAAQPWLTATFQQELYREEYWLELMPKEATKANAARKLKELLGCDRMVAFGDAINDLPLFEAADVKCAVANAVPKLQGAATEIIGSNEEDGVAKWLLRNVSLPKPPQKKVSLRQFRESDLEEVYRLFRDTVHTVCQMEYTREQVEAWALPVEKWDREAWRSSLLRHFTLVAEDETGRITGFADLDGGYVDRLYVHRDFQGRGAAKALASALEAEALGQGQARITVHASRSARGFFEKLGYRAVKDQRVKRPHPETGQMVELENTVMEKGLKQV